MKLWDEVCVQRERLLAKSPRTGDDHSLLTLLTALIDLKVDLMEAIEQLKTSS